MARIAAALIATMAILPATAAAQAPVDSGFRPATDGFSFENYGDGQPNLGPAEMRRLFGDGVCGSKPADDCALTPAAKEQMDRANGTMSGGHCMGFSVAALRFFAGAQTFTPFGAAPTFSLALQPPIAREIAYGFVYQMLDSVTQAKVEGTPKQILEHLRKNLASKQETFTIALFKPEFKDGHAITPYAIEDRANNKSAIKVYDNNFPNQEREMIIDTVADTFEYNTATNPQAAVDLYKGDAKTNTLFLYPTTPGQGVQPCAFCQTAAANQQKVEVASTGALTRHANVTISDGRRTVGYRIAPRNEPRDEPAFARRSWINDPRYKPINLIEQRDSRIQREPYYRAPANQAYTMTLSNNTGRSLRDEGLRITGPAFGVTVRGLSLVKGQRVKVRLSADGRQIPFSSNRALDTSTVSIGRTEPGVDHAFVLKRDNVLPRGEKLVFAMDPGTDKLRIQGDAGSYDLLARRVDESGEQVLVRNDVKVMDAPGETDDELTLDYANWDGSAGSGIELEDAGGQERQIDSQVPPGTNPEQAEEGVTDEEVPGGEDEE